MRARPPAEDDPVTLTAAPSLSPTAAALYVEKDGGR